jgi:hypothetical protein
MKTTFNLLLAAALIGFTACSDGDSKTNRINSTANAGTTPMATPSGNVALNPEHGQPGHRCDLEVGAPLNTPAQPKLTTPQPTLQPQPSFQPQPSGSVAAGTNPPHGQPGHDCAVPVGAPLPK